jgi:hypothetical protein
VARHVAALEAQVARLSGEFDETFLDEALSAARDVDPDVNPAAIAVAVSAAFGLRLADFAPHATASRDTLRRRVRRQKNEILLLTRQVETLGSQVNELQTRQAC